MKALFDFDFTCWRKRWSTWLAALMAAASAALGAYAMFPGRLQALIPDWALAVCGVVLMVGPVLIPLATSAKQKNIPSPHAGNPPAS